MDLAGLNGTDLQPAEPEALEQAWVPCADKDQGRTQDVGAEASAGSGASGRNRRQEVETRPAAAGEALPRHARIRLSSEIRALLERGKRKRTALLEVFFAPSPASRSRLGLIVPKHGQQIVDRNRVKRRLREIGRREVLPGLDASGVSSDVLIRARRKAYGASYEELLHSVQEAVEALCSSES